jgi:asparagine synthase (glutamine-hydrolysing)
MCGIGGFIGFKDEKLIRDMSECMKHRGPDGDGFYIDGHVSLMNRRLAIIDRKGGDQPIYNEDKSVVVVYNGEIYNYLELKNELETLGHKFKTKADTEVLVHGYEEWGELFFDKCNGMFGAALYDLKKKKLVLARDHFGIKPVYFAKIDSKDTSAFQLIFSSEIKPIIQSGLIDKKVNERILYRYLKFRIHDDDRETFFDGIYRLLPGEVLVFENKKLEIKEFSSLKKDLRKSIEVQNNREFDEMSVTKFRQLLTDAVKSRLMSEVPVGTALSGGLDSSTVVAIINKLLNEHDSGAESVGTKQNTFSAVFPKSSNDEEKYVDAVLNKSEKIASHKVFPKPEEFFTDLEDFIRTQEEPTISTGPYAQYKVMQEAAKHVTVLLDGQGADEMMAGYLPYYFVYLNQLKKERKYSRLLNEVWTSKDVLFKYFTYKLLQTFSIKKVIPVLSILNTTFAGKFPEEKFIVNNSNLKQRLFDDIFSNSLQSLLRYEDRNTMRFSLEGRVPFLDFNLLRYLFSLPDESIIKNGWNKYILRQAVGDLLPKMIVNRRNKIGFTTPENEWFLRMKNRIYGIFMSESFVNRPYFNQPEVIKAFQQFIDGKTDDTLLFWRLMNVELWLREFFDEKSDITKTKTKWTLGDPNNGKNIEIQLGTDTYSRFPVKTELVKKGDDIKEFVTGYIKTSSKALINGKKKWYVLISEKIVAISQGRSYFIWDINPTWLATTLSKFVTRTPYGIGLGSPWTMQIAIDEIGLTRVLFAAIASVITKPLGMKGIFYKIVGPEIAAIDGPTEYSVYPSNVSAKLAPKDPKMVAEHIRIEIMKQVPDENFAGVVIIDANDLGRNVLGNATEMPDEFFENIMKDNPMGQGSEQTPIVILV